MALTQECLETWSTSFACQISTLAQTYFKELQIGSECADTYLFQVEVATALLEQICNISLEDETCLSEADICEIIDKLKYILNNPCDC